MEFVWIAVIAIIIILFLALFFTFVPVALWISALAAGVKVGIVNLIAMRLRRVVPSRIVNPMIKASKAGLDVNINNLEAHYPCRRQRGPCRRFPDRRAAGRHPARI